MPFIPHTPESLLPRSDSKNPSTTCKGITSSGRPCRRSLAASPRSSPSPSPHGGRGVLAVLSDVDGNHEGAAAFFCWQHKEQADTLANGGNSQRTKVVELKEKSSLETLVGRLGVLDIDEGGGHRKKRKSSQDGLPIRRETLPKQWQNVPGPLMAVPEDPFTGPSTHAAAPRLQGRPRANPRTDLHFSFFCCMRSTDIDTTPPPRVRRVLQDGKAPQSTLPVVRMPPTKTSPIPRRPVSTGQGSPQKSPSPAPPTDVSSRSSLPRDPSSHTQTLLSYIPSNLSPQTTSLLLAELAKPLTTMDQENGYIYIFWLTPNTSSPLPPQAASFLLAPPSPNQPQRGRRTSDLLQDFARYPESAPGEKKIMLKIGRASNVQRRLNEWTRQCNYNLSLIRYYPYHSSSPPVTPPSTPRKVPYVQRVERLIHLELAEKRVKRSCAGCGKEHREWFEVSATREGVKDVDKVVRRWVAWGEGKTL